MQCSLFGAITEMSRMSIRRYSELIRIPTFSDRFTYASLQGKVGAETFAGRRLLNQDFYRSAEWRRAREVAIVRDLGCDLAHPDVPIAGKIIIHHLNPITLDDLSNLELILDPEFMVCVSLDTHNAIHYGSVAAQKEGYTPRSQNDTCPWR